MEAALVRDLVDLATTQGRPPRLQVITTHEGKTVNMEPRGNHQPVDSVGYHETAVKDRDAEFLMAQHQGDRFPTSWNGIIGFDGRFFTYVPQRTHMAWAQGVSAVESLDWDSMDCKVHMYSLEVCGDNLGTPVNRAQLQTIVQFMWWADEALGIKMSEWEKRYFTHAGIGRFPAPPAYPHQRRGRKSDPRGYNPFVLVKEQLGGSTTTKPPTGIYEVVVSTPTANVRNTPQILKTNIREKKANGVMVTVVDWEHGDVHDGSDWWARLRDGGYMHITVLQLHIGVPATPPIGTWWAHVSTRNANVHSDRTSSPNTVIAQVGNRKAVQIADWQLGENVLGTAWWGRRIEGGWMSMAVLTDTPPTIAAPITGRMKAQATLLQNKYAPFTRFSDDHVRCGDDDHDA